MVSIEQVKTGLASYLDKELLPKFAGQPVKQLLFGSIAAIYIKKLDTLLDENSVSIIQPLGIIDNGMVDIDLIYEEVKHRINNNGLPVDIPGFGVLTVYPPDIDLLHKYIVGG